MTLTEELRRMNVNENRTDVENLFLKDIIEQDTEDMLREETELDAIEPAFDNTGLFDDNSSEDPLDDLDVTISADDFNSIELF